MDPIRFAEACARVIGVEYERGSVGLLAEKTLHAVLKEYFEPDHSFHEVKIGSHHADICRDGRIIEVQTRSLGNLRKKLSRLLEDYPVTVVYPIPATKYLCWMDPESGEVLSKRKVAKKGSFFDAGRELWALSSLLAHPNLTVCLLRIDMEEYRLQNGWSKDGKRGSERYDRIPLALVDELVLDTPASFEGLFPTGLPERFTAKDFKRAVKGGPRTAPALLSVLVRMGIVVKVGTEGRAFVYKHA